MGAGASRKYVVEEIRAATQADVALACAELSIQDKDKLIGLLEASEQVRSQSPAGDPTLEHARGTPGVRCAEDSCRRAAGELHLFYISYY